MLWLPNPRDIVMPGVTTPADRYRIDVAQAQLATA
jgi:hypothetical protein